jgi:DNA repair ATPase RecN
MSHHGDRRQSEIITNDPKDAVIARLLERTEWMIENDKETRRIVERLDQTLDHVSEANGKLAAAVDSLTRAVEGQEEMEKRIGALEVSIAEMRPQIDFWADVRDRLFWIGLGALLAAFAAGWGGAHITMPQAPPAIRR